MRAPEELLEENGWQAFAWFGDGLADRAFSVTTKTVVRVTVTDAFCRGDTLSVTEGDAMLTVTPTVPLDDCQHSFEYPNVSSREATT